jgi:predicted PurR-regulated permease PerM
MSTSRPILFWIATFAATTAVLVLLRQVLLPFVAGMVLAYLLDPLANRIERLGVNRLVATLAIVAFAVALITVIVIGAGPVIVRELSYFFENLPLYVRRCILWQPIQTGPG